MKPIGKFIIINKIEEEHKTESGLCYDYYIFWEIT